MTAGTLSSLLLSLLAVLKSQKQLSDRTVDPARPTPPSLPPSLPSSGRPFPSGYRKERDALRYDQFIERRLTVSTVRVKRRRLAARFRQAAGKEISRMDARLRLKLRSLVKSSKVHSRLRQADRRTSRNNERVAPVARSDTRSGLRAVFPPRDHTRGTKLAIP